MRPSSIVTGDGISEGVDRLKSKLGMRGGV
eukprot:COSAG02_NODE_30970_length_541_cov_5.884615_1_plen_29_part_10